MGKSWIIKPPVQVALLRKTKIELRGVFSNSPSVCSWGSSEQAGQRLLCWTWESTFILSLTRRDTGTQQNLTPSSTHAHMKERVALKIRFSPVLSVWGWRCYHTQHGNPIYYTERRRSRMGSHPTNRACLKDDNHYVLALTPQIKITVDRQWQALLST